MRFDVNIILTFSDSVLALKFDCTLIQAFSWILSTYRLNNNSYFIFVIFLKTTVKEEKWNETFKVNIKINWHKEYIIIDTDKYMQDENKYYLLQIKYHC